MTALDLRLSCYAITDQASALGRSDEVVAQALLRGGCTCLQYRAKKVAARVQWRVASALRDLAHAAGALFIVNDRVDLALDCGADGVHLGQDDLPVAAARSLSRRAGNPGLLVGLSTHSLSQALAAERERPDYIGCGPIYETRTKENNVPAIGLGVLAEVLKAVSMPVVAIGGIQEGRLAELAKVGTRHCAIVTALTSAEDPAEVSLRTWSAWRRLGESVRIDA
ncbi:MAG: thiamine phosphate synthase [bacterium]